MSLYNFGKTNEGNREGVIFHAKDAVLYDYDDNGAICGVVE